MNEKLEKYSPYVLGLLRIIIGYMFLLHGTAKFFEFPMSMTNGNGSVPLFSQYGVGGILEIVGGFLFIIGLFTRPVAFLLSGMMAFAFFFVHGANPLLPLLKGGELPALYCFVFFFFIFAGSGKFSVDNRNK
ncbi:DoxX family protein [Pasteurella bettyae]|uniref:DoxX family protein n=1 Tax=Pasteurella bettyae CCUG 2042 TaxID=1095749 RepID=I3DBA1_9PAST|nr:DoxX family protein [Pasteurella bettyae]EIJ68994.1 DoxX family protein [Pasteurella bettyae CCUG 2042]SUB22816.1 DoxX [Pasteurella bettyae]